MIPASGTYKAIGHNTLGTQNTVGVTANEHGAHRSLSAADTGLCKPWIQEAWGTADIGNREAADLAHSLHGTWQTWGTIMMGHIVPGKQQIQDSAGPKHLLYLRA